MTQKAGGGNAGKDQPASACDRIRTALNTPALYAVLVGGFGLLIPWDFVRDHKDIYLKDTLAAVINLGAIAIGFLMTAKSILYTASNSVKMVRFKESPEFVALMSFFSRNIAWLLALVLASVAMLCTISIQALERYYHIAFAGWAALLAGATAATLISFDLYEHALKVDGEEMARRRTERAEADRKRLEADTKDQLDPSKFGARTEAEGG